MTDPTGSFEPGRRLGPYEILALLGKGGMGEVWSARDTRLGREVAIKVLPAVAAEDRARLERFEKEARAASALNHPNIVTIHELGKEGPLTFIVMERVEGETLRDRLSKSPLPLMEALSLAAQMADGLARAHAAGIVHRDLKPENLMVTREGLVKILDFGLAKVLFTGASGDSYLPTLPAARTADGILLGTVGYMSPEQAAGRPVDFRSDQFALGAILYEMVTRRRLFERDTAVETLAAIVGAAPDLSALPPAFKPLLARCLEKDPDRRFASTTELSRALRDVSAGPSAALPPLPAAAARRPRRAVLVAGLTLVALAVAAGFVFFRPRPIDSIAILPFVNASGDPNAEYLSDGLTEALINNVSQLSNLKVIARSSVFRYKGKEVDPMAVARELGVRAVLTGRVVPHGDALTVSAELVDTKDDRHLWGEQYNRPMSDLLAVQEAIAREITENLRLRITGAEKTRLARRATRDPEAYELYLRGQYFWGKRTRDATSKAIEQFSLAKQRDPAFALAYLGLANVQATMGIHYRNFAPPKESFPLSLDAARTALALDDSLGEAHGVLGWCLFWYERDFAGAEKAFRRAIALNPGDPNARHFYSHYLLAFRRFDESLAQSLKAIELDPVSVVMVAHLGEHYRQERRFDLAIRQSRKALELGPYSTSEIEIGDALIHEGKVSEAVAEMEKARTDYPENTLVLAALGEAYAFAGRRAEAMAILKALEERAAREYIGAETLAQICIGLGDRDEAFRWLERAFDDRSTMLTYLNVEPMFDPLRGDPRFSALAKRVGLPTLFSPHD